MSTEHDFGTNSTQYKFLDQHMQTVDRSKTPWLIFAGHRFDDQNYLAACAGVLGMSLKFVHNNANISCGCGIAISLYVHVQLQYSGTIGKANN